MKETVLDVLMYLFDNYIEEDVELDHDEDTLRLELKEAGFGDYQVSRAFDWLEGLAMQKESTGLPTLGQSPSMRILCDEEANKIDAESYGFLLFLEQIGVLDGNDRELVIDRLMALGTDEIELQQLKWVVLMVLFNQPGKEAAFAWVEDLVMEEFNTSLH
jgi:Smg protein